MGSEELDGFQRVKSLCSESVDVPSVSKGIFQKALMEDLHNQFPELEIYQLSVVANISTLVAFRSFEAAKQELEEVPTKDLNAISVVLRNTQVGQLFLAETARRLGEIKRWRIVNPGILQVEPKEPSSTPSQE